MKPVTVIYTAYSRQRRALVLRYLDKYHVHSISGILSRFRAQPAEPYLVVGFCLFRRQTVLVENLQEGRPPPQLESCDLVFLIKLKLLGYRPSGGRGVLESRGFSLHASKAGLSKGDILLSASEKLDLFHAPLDLAKGGSW